MVNPLLCPLHGRATFALLSPEGPVRMISLRLVAIGCLFALAPATATAQCSDGSPPPCGGARTIVRANVPVPAATIRSRHFLVLPFRNVTRQAEHDWLVEGSTTMLSDALGRWQGITVVSDERLYPALKRAGIASGSVIEVPRVRRVSEETGGWTAITGEVISTGGRIRVTARAWDVPTNKELVSAAGEVPAGGDIRLAYDSVSLRLLRSAGFADATVDLADATTRDLDSYRAYLRGLANMRRSEVKAALASFQESVRADSGFALAWARLAETTLAADPASLFNPANKGAQYAERAAALSSKLPPRHRQLVLAINATFHAQFAETRRNLDALLAADSSDLEALQQMVGLEMFDPILVNVPGGQRPRGSLNRAARIAKQVAELDPSRSQMFGVLASIYANAGVPGESPALGISRVPASFPDLMQGLRQRENVRIYGYVLRDTIALVPAESLSAIPKDSLKAMQRQARAVARSWAERWVSVAPGEAAPHQLVSELYAIDREFPAALRALAKAESIGVQTPAWSPPARRLFFSAKSGDLAMAGRLSDSLTTTGFFANPTNAMVNGDTHAWAFALQLLANHTAQAATLLEQATALMKMINPAGATPGYTAFGRLMGSEDPEQEPGMSRAFRARQLDSALAHIREYTASERLAPWMPLFLPMLAEAADSAHPRAADLLKAADVLATAGRTPLAVHLAINAVRTDSTLEPAAAERPWYRAGAEALNAIRLATQSRFHAGAATVGATEAVFEWKVDDAAPFMWNRPETPAGRGEYRWEVTLETGDRYMMLVASASAREAGAAVGSGTLANILTPSAFRAVVNGSLGANGVKKDTTQLQGVALRTEMPAGSLRLIVTDPGVLAQLRKSRPAQASFKFAPCVKPVGVVGKEQCMDEKVTISYP